MRGTSYKLIIVYSPKICGVSAIRGWKCNCAVGNRKVGCCSHVACVIFYLSFGKYRIELKKTGFKFDNFFQKLGLNCDSDDEDEDDENKKEEDEDDFKKHPEDCHCLLSEKESSDSFETDLSDFSSISLLQSKRKMSSSSSLETVNIRPKFKDSLLSKLADILPKWGGIIESKNNLYECYKNYEVTDTCTIDYFMLAISFSVEINGRIDSLLRSNYFSNQKFISQINRIRDRT
jgi:hypothetical protein